MRAAAIVEKTWMDQEKRDPYLAKRGASPDEVFATRVRFGSKKLADCELPDGFRLLDARPRQMWIGQQVRWAFRLGFDVVGESLVVFTSEYECRIPDSVQMAFALREFSRKLMAAGYEVQGGDTQRNHNRLQGARGVVNGKNRNNRAAFEVVAT